MSVLDIENVIVEDTLSVDGYVINPSYSSVGQFLAYDGHAYIPTIAVTSIATDSTLVGGTITTIGTLGLNLANANTWTADQTVPTLFATNTKTNHFVADTSHSAPTAVAATALGSTGSIVMSSDGTSSDMAGTFYLAPAGTGITTGLLATITFNTAYTTKPTVILTPANITAAAYQWMWVEAADVTTTTFTIRCETNAPSSGQAYKYNYFVIGR